MNKEELVKAIYEKVANKELSFGCKCEYQDFSNCIIVWKAFNIWKIEIAYQWTNVFEKDKIYKWYNQNNFSNVEVREEELIIKWHPVLIWTILAYARNKNNVEDEINIDYYNEVLADLLWWQNWIWNKINLPIEKQSEECIKYIFDLINND